MAAQIKKPIRVFWSELGKRFYASQHYKTDGSRVTITGQKFDVTDDIAQAVIAHDLVFSVAKIPIAVEETEP
jgi:hypothetical protein